MAKTKTSRQRGRAASKGSDNVFLLKLVLYLIIGSQWIRFTNDDGLAVLPVPIGLAIGLLFATHDHFKIDRKIEYALLLVAMLVGFWSRVGIYVAL
jgi:hypothetical protein